MLIRTHRTSVLRWSLALFLETIAVGTLAAEKAKQARTGEAAILAALDEKIVVEFIEPVACEPVYQGRFARTRFPQGPSPTEGVLPISRKYANNTESR